MKEILIINGSGGVGKGEFVKALKRFATVRYISIADKAKNIAKDIGWDQQKRERDRKFLYDLKHLIDEYNDYNYHYVQEEINKFLKKRYEEILCIDMREKEQIERAKADFGAKTILVTRPDVAQITSNPADKNVNDIEYDFTVDNDGDLNDLLLTARNIVEILRQQWRATHKATKPNEYNKVIYISHPFGGEQKNIEDIERIILSLIKDLPDYLFLSPCHAFGYQYKELDYEQGLSECIWLLDQADEMWVFGDWENSKGCFAEIDYCETMHIPYHIFKNKEEALNEGNTLHDRLS